MLVGKKYIIFITVYPFNEDYALKYGFDILSKRGFNIVILNVFNFLHPKALEELQYNNLLEPVMGVEQFWIESGKDLRKHLDSIRGWKIAFLVVFPVIKLLRVLRRANVDYIITNGNIHPPIMGGEKTIFGRFFRILKTLIANPVTFFSNSFMGKVKNYMYRLSHRLPYFFGIRCPKYYFLGSEAYPYCYPPSKTQVIHAHSFDYDRCLKNKGKPKAEYIPDGEYYVHIADTPWGGHDYPILKITGGTSKEDYSKIINAFFDFVERNTGKRIIIAAHPKHTDEDNVYNGRPFLYDTEQLIKYSSGVICHYSGAVKFAVIHKKPVCFISIWKMKGDTFFQNNIIAHAKALGSEIHYIDRNADLQRMLDKGIFSYDPSVYEDFERKYIKLDKNQDRLFGDIVADTLLGKMASNG